MKKYLTYMGLCGVFEIALALYLTFWRHQFWNYVADKNYHGFVVYLLIFTVVALCLCVISATATYFGSMAAIQWRKKLNLIAIGQESQHVENVNQRIQQDCYDYPILTINITYNIIKAICYVITFSLVIVYDFKVSYLAIITIYAIISTYMANKIGSPLLAINYKCQQVEATYRNNLNKNNFKDCISYMKLLANKLKHLQYFQILYGQVAVVIPLVIIAPDYFMGVMTLGGLMQCSSLMGTVSDNLSYGINSFDVINKLRSCSKRLRELGVIQ
jgi:putative ATP-binding cassette transporter